MVKKYTLLSCLLLLTIPFFAQNKADQILKKAENIYVKDGAVKADFTAEIFQNKGGVPDIINGTVYMNGAKFYLDGNDLKVWYNGKSQWVLLANSNEVNLTEPTDEEMASMNPAIFFKQYDKGFKSVFKGVTNIKGISCSEILLTPTKTNTGISKLIIFIDQSTNRIKGLTVENTNGIINKIIISNYLYLQKLSDSIFEFDSMKYPGVEIIDLR
ncbi:MAG: LolA family protein [Bacteroidales bacterium]